MQRKLVLADARKRGRERVDGVVGPDERAVPADVGHFELIVRIDFLARLQFEDGRTAFAQNHAAAVGVEGKVGIDQRRDACRASD